jgi:hypothetical protein
LLARGHANCVLAAPLFERVRSLVLLGNLWRGLASSHQARVGHPRVAEEERKRLQIEAEQKRQQEAARRKIEKYRWRRVLELSDRWHGANRVKSFIAEIEAMAITGDDPLAGGKSRDEWLAWIKQRLSVHDPLEAGVDAVWSNLSGVTSWEYND